MTSTSPSDPSSSPASSSTSPSPSSPPLVYPFSNLHPTASTLPPISSTLSPLLLPHLHSTVPFTTESKSVVHRSGKWLTVEHHSVVVPPSQLNPNEIRIPDWSWVDSPNFINICGITKDKKFILFKQTKYAIPFAFSPSPSGCSSLAPIGGYVEKNEDPLTAAKRELLEESHYSTCDDNWILLYKGVVDANRGCGISFLYLALDCVKIAKEDEGKIAVSDDLESQQFILLDENAVELSLFRGDFKVLSWSHTMSLALMWVKRFGYKGKKEIEMENQK